MQFTEHTARSLFPGSQVPGLCVPPLQCDVPQPVVVPCQANLSDSPWTTGLAEVC
jgi:hypothetical protein